MVDISVRTFDELMLVGLLILISAIINAIIYGQFAILTEELKRDSNEFLDKLNLVNSVMNDQRLPLTMKKEIRNFILTTHSLKRLQEELIGFNENISPSLRSLVRVKLFSRTLSGSVMARYMKTSLYKEWIELNKLNRSLEAAG